MSKRILKKEKILQLAREESWSIEESKLFGEYLKKQEDKIRANERAKVINEIKSRLPLIGL